PQLEAVVMRALSKNADDRYPDCASMIRDLDAVPQGQAAGGATVHASVLLDRASMERPGGPSPGELRDQKRRAYRRRLAAGVAATLAAAALFAFHLAKHDSPPPDGPAQAEVSTTTTLSSQPPIQPQPPVQPQPRPSKGRHPAIGGG